MCIRDREIPGPEEAVKALAPFQPAPIAIPIAANSSSAWTMEYFLLPEPGSILKRLQYLLNASTTEVDGVNGYQDATVAPPYTQPSPTAVFPSIKILPSFLLVALSLSGSGHSKFSLAY